jgi:integrase
MKRENGAGSIYQRKKDGRWVAKVFDPVSGKYAYRYAKSRNQAQAILREMLNRIDGGEPPLDSSLTFEEYATAWLAGSAGRRRSESTIYEYQSRLTNHAFPVIGRRALSRITVRDIEQVLDTAAANGLGLSSIKGLRNAMSALFEDAKKHRSVAANPVKSAELPMLPQPEGVKPPSTKEVRSILSRAQSLTDDDQAELGRIMLMCAHTGARIGEVLAAQWSDFNKDMSVWHLHSTLSRNRRGRLTVSDRTKNGEPRQVGLTVQLKDALRKQQEFVAYRRSSGRHWVDEGWVFPTSVGTVRDESNLRNLLKRTFPDWSYCFHGFRHWFVSHGLVTSGVGLVQVSRLVGHRSTRTTMDVYGHLLAEGSQQVLDNVSQALTMPPEKR